MEDFALIKSITLGSVQHNSLISCLPQTQQQFWTVDLLYTQQEL